MVDVLTASPTPTDAAAGYDFYGVGLTIVTASPELAASLARDFEYFAVAPAAPTAVATSRAATSALASRGPACGGAPIVIHAHHDEPPWQRIPSRPASMLTPNAVTYDQGRVRTNDYNGRALAIYDFDREHGEVWSTDADLLYEIVYLMALSRIGERHDLIGIHRVHALGVAAFGRAALVVLPEGGGKSTLALELLRRPEISLLSDDTPLLTRGRVLAFPTRIGVRGAVEGVGAEHVRTVRRRDRGAKMVIDYSAFRDRVVREASPAALVIGVRHGGTRSWLEPVAARTAFAPLAVNLMFGLGLPQVVEYFLRGGALELVRKAAIMRSRLVATVRLLRNARSYRLVLGRDDPAAAAEAVASVLGL